VSGLKQTSVIMVRHPLLCSDALKNLYPVFSFSPICSGFPSRA